MRDLHEVVAKGGKANCPVRMDEVSSAIDSRLSPRNRPDFKTNIFHGRWRDSQPPQSQLVAGFLRSYDDHAIVKISMDLPVVWQRFVAAKELAHLLIDTEASHFTAAPVALVQGLIDGLPCERVTDDLESEHYASFAALEILLPWELRVELEKTGGTTATDTAIAYKFVVPEKIIYLALRSPYSKLSIAANSVPRPQRQPPILK